MFTNVRNVIINNKRVKSIKLLNGSGALYIEPVIIDLSIDEQVIETGESATLTATLQDANGNTGVTINFEVYKDDWLVTTISGVTDNTGEATATYNSLGLGNVTIKATKTDKSATSNSVSIEDRYKYIDENYEWDIISRSTTNWRLTDFDLPTNCIIEWQTTTDVFVPIAIGDNTRDDDDYPRWVCNIDGTTMTILTADWNFHTESISFTPDQDNIYKIIRRGWEIGFYVNDVLICEQTTHNLFNISTKFRTNVYNVVDFEYVNVTYLTELELTPAPSTIGIGDTSVLTATLRSNPSLITGKTIQFTQKDKMLFKDGGVTGNYNSKWDILYVSKTVDTNGTTFTATETNASARASMNPLDNGSAYDFEYTPLIWEFDVVNIVGEVQAQFIQQNPLRNNGFKLGTSYNGSHVKIEYTGSKLVLYKDNVFVSEISEVYDNTIRIGFAFYSINRSITVKNVVVKTDDVIDSVITDSSGVATTNYTGTGYGLANFVAVTGDLQSETFIVEDCLFYDPCVTGLSDLNDYTYIPTSTSSLDLTGNGIVFKNVNNSAQLYSKYLIEGDFEIILEAKIKMAMVRFGVINENSDSTRFQVPVTPLDTFYLYRINRYNDEISCAVSSDNGASWNNLSVEGNENVGSEDCSLYFLNYSSNAERVLTFKNIKIFSI